MCLRDDRNRISVCGYAGIKTSGDAHVQGWNGEMGRWMVVKRFTRLLDEFSTLGLSFTMDFGLLVISTGSSCRKHRVSCKMQNFRKNEAKNLGKDSSKGACNLSCLFLLYNPPAMTFLQPAIYSKEVRVFSFFLFSPSFFLVSFL